MLPRQASWSQVLNLVKECELLIRISDSPKRRENGQRMMEEGTRTASIASEQFADNVSKQRP